LDLRQKAAPLHTPHAATEVVILPSLKEEDSSLETNELHRHRRVYEPDPNVTIDRIGQPRGIPDQFKARNEIAAGFEAIIPAIGVSKNVEWINYIYYNQQRCINYTDDALSALGEQLKATSAMAWQKRQALDWLLAEKGGVCALIGDMCCTFIPNNTAPEGSFTLAMNKLKQLRQEVTDNAGHGQDWFTWLNLKIWLWGSMFMKIGLTLLVVLVILGLIFCCCIPILRSMVASRLEKEMILTVTDIVDTKRLEWEYVGNDGHSGNDDESYGPRRLEPLKKRKKQQQQQRSS